MGALLGRDDGRIADERVVDTRVRNQVGLELVQIDIESTIEAQRGCDGADNLGDQAVQVLVVGTGNIEAATADVVDSFVIDEERAVGVLDSAVGGEHSVVGLNDGCGNARRGIDGKLELALLAVISRETLEEQGTEARAGSSAERMENEEALERRAVV